MPAAPLDGEGAGMELLPLWVGIGVELLDPEAALRALELPAAPDEAGAEVCGSAGALAARPACAAAP